MRTRVSLPDRRAMSVLIKDVFYIVSFLKEFWDGKRHTKASFKCSEILSNTDQTVTIIRGEAGTGKTVFLRELLRDILEAREDNPSNACFEGATKYNLALPIECRFEESGSLVEFMRNNFHTFMSQYTDARSSLRARVDTKFDIPRGWLRRSWA